MNDYYDPTGTPEFNARAVSATARNESALVEQAFDKLAAPDVLGSSAQNYGLDTGMPSALAVNINPNVTAPFDGMEIVVKVSYAATGPSTITAGQLAVAPVLRMDGSPTQPDDWLSGQIISMRYDATRGAYQYTPAYAGVAQVVVPLSDAAPIVKNAADPTKQLKLDLSLLSTAITRTFKVPDHDGFIGADINRSPRTANVMLVAADAHNLIDFTPTTPFVQTIATGLYAGWWVLLRNSALVPVDIESVAPINTVSVTSNTISAGTTWTIPAGLSIAAGDLVTIRRTSALYAQKITATAVSYSATTGVLAVAAVARVGSGTFTDWTITIRPAAGGIDGLPMFTMYPNEVRLMQLDGARFNSVVFNKFNYESTTAETYIHPPGYPDVDVDAQAAGGGGGGGYCTVAGNGNGKGGRGGGGGARVRRSVKLAAGQAVAMSSGSGGIAGAASSTVNTGVAGGNGGNTTFGSAVTAYGGAGGAAGSTVASGNSAAGAAGGGSAGAGIQATASSCVGGLPSSAYFGASTSAADANNISGGGAGNYQGTAGSAENGGGAGGGITPDTQPAAAPGGGSLNAGAGGGAGGGIGSAAAGAAGGTNRYTPGAGAAGGAAGVAGSPGATDRTGGGGGGGSTTADTGQAGANGGNGGRGAGGGGGAASNFPAASGAGGRGGDGFITLKGA